MNPSRGSPSRSRDKFPLNGLFDDGVWRCNCTPRLPAEHFQTKNGRQNHGRWFYTCQSKRPKGCGFFLWDDDAKLREAATVLNNSRTEPLSAANAGFTTAAEIHHNATTSPTARDVHHPVTPTKQPNSDWATPKIDSAAHRTASAAATANMPPPFETPRKQARTERQSSPGKRKRDEDHRRTPGNVPRTPDADADDVFTTPASRMRNTSADLGPGATGLVTPRDTPTPARFRNVPGLEGSGILPDAASSLGRPPPPVFGSSPVRLGDAVPDTELSREVLGQMGYLSIDVTEELAEAIMAVAFKYTRKMRAVEKGRDVLRRTVETKTKEIEKLNKNVGRLEGELEDARTIIKTLRAERENR